MIIPFSKSFGEKEHHETQRMLGLRKREPAYVRHLLHRELSFAETAVAFHVGELLTIAGRPG